MRDILIGDVKNMYVSNLELIGKNINNLFSGDSDKVFSEVVVERDSEFYKNIFGNIVNFRYDNVLASRGEAIDYLLENPVSSILFVDYKKLVYRGTVSNRIVKEKKKLYIKK